MDEQPRGQDMTKRTQESVQRSMQEAMRRRISAESASRSGQSRKAGPPTSGDAEQRGEPRMDEQVRGQDTAKRTQESAPRSTQEALRISDELARLSAESIWVCTRINQEVWRDVMDLGAKTVREGAHLATQLQQAGLEAWRDSQDASVRWATLWPEAFRDPLHYYERAFKQGMEMARRSLHFTRQSSETVTRSLQQMQQAAEEATRSVQRTFQDGLSKLQEVTQRTEHLHAA